MQINYKKQVLFLLSQKFIFVLGVHDKQNRFQQVTVLENNCFSLETGPHICILIVEISSAYEGSLIGTQ